MRMNIVFLHVINFILFFFLARNRQLRRPTGGHYRHDDLLGASEALYAGVQKAADARSQLGPRGTVGCGRQRVHVLGRFPPPFS